jgi:DNA topoisomerase-1
MQLVIVESPKKARTIEKILGAGFRVEASFGHVRDLPPKRLGVAIEDGFAAEWVPVARAKARLAALKKAASGAERVVLATDPDREGEAIAWHIADALKLRAPTRVVFHAITTSAVRAAFRQPRQLDTRLVEAQQARRVLDRLVGYQVSPLLWRKIARGTSAGRVQSVALRLVVEREREIRAFVPVEYWTIDAQLHPSGRPNERFTARLVDVELRDQATAEQVVADLARGTYRVASQSEKTIERGPAPPFTTSTMQQAAAARLRMGGKRTMQLAQSLYEAGLITYHRTDAVRVEPEAVEAARSLIARRFGAEYLPARARFYANKVKNAQEAHEAIRPVEVTRLPEQVGAEEAGLYRLIWQRFVASQMAAARYGRKSVDVLAQADRAYTLRAVATTLLFAGWLAVYGVEPGPSASGSATSWSAGSGSAPSSSGSARGSPLASSSPSPAGGGGRRGRPTGEGAGVEGDPEADDESTRDREQPEATNTSLPKMRDGEPLALVELQPEQHFTRPPPRFNEASLVKELERAGVGRPSTYAAIVGTLDERGYVEREKGAFVPTELGFAVNDFVVSFFPEIADLRFTAHLEDGLDAVARGEQGWQALLGEFYRPFRGALDVAGRAATSFVARPEPVKRARRARPPDPLTRRTVERGAKRAEPAAGGAGTKPVGELCPLCGRAMVERKGPYSTFLGCTGFPQCRGTVKLETRASARPGKSRSPRRKPAPKPRGSPGEAPRRGRPGS